MRVYTVENTVLKGRQAFVTVNGRLQELCVRAFAFGPFVAAEVIRTYQDGKPIVFGDRLRSRWVFGIGQVTTESAA